MTAPIVIPCTKYFCTSGYARTIGPVTTMVSAIFRDWVGNEIALDEALEDAIHSAYDWISLELTEEEPDFPPVSDVADLGKSEGEIARNIAVNIRLFEGWDE